VNLAPNYSLGSPGDPIDWVRQLSARSFAMQTNLSPPTSFMGHVMLSSFDLHDLLLVLLFFIFQDWSNGHLKSQPHECSFID
jgi:hypothetical protein